jgi:hypothetical protein
VAGKGPAWRAQIAGRLSAGATWGAVEMARIIVANRHGHQVVEYDTTTDTEEARRSVEQAERILQEARDQGCRVSKKVDGRHVIDDSPFDPSVEEYQVIAPLAGG